MTSPMICSGVSVPGFEVEVAGADAGVAGEAARGVAGGVHVELARGVGVHDVVLEDAAFDEDGAARGKAFAVEGRGAEAADAVEDEGAVVDDGDVFAGDLFAEHAAEEGGVAIDGVAVGGVEDVADDGLGHLGREDDGGLLGLDLACAEAAAGCGVLLRWPISSGSSSLVTVRAFENQ